MFSSHTSILKPGNIVTNGLETYTVLGKIKTGKVCTIYRVSCKSGRLRGRELALKKVPITAPTLSEQSSSLHHTLHHPNIVSLFSSFSTSIESVNILELCSVGNLADFLQSRKPPTLVESELRLIIKSLCDALLYLRKETVIHRDIKPLNILLTSDYGVKLSGFNFATYLHSVDPTVSFFGDSPNYVAPEVITKTPYDFAADVWSLGCVIIACLSGSPPFDGGTIPETLDKILNAEYMPPNHASVEINELITSILQIRPENRIHLHNIISHPFFASPLPVKSLCPTGDDLDSQCNHLLPILRVERTRLPPLLPKPVAPYSRARSSSVHFAPGPSSGTRVVLANIANTALRDLLRDELVTGVTKSVSTRRVVSDPTPRSKDEQAEELVALQKGNKYTLPPFLTNSANDKNLKPGTLPGSTAPRVADGKLKPEAFIENIERPGEKTSHGGPTSNAPGNALPVGTTRPAQFDTSQMNSQTHKTAYGQLVVLPSRAVLVDFRESQRRRGLKGDEVLVVDPTGSKISVYSAPHLSVPCCLVEPSHQFSISTLPPTYWKQYNDAGRLIDQIKQRTPKFVMYTNAAKCTLMANVPQGDIEILFGSSFVSDKDQDQRPEKRVRIRYSRRNQSIEIALQMSSARGKEWTKRVFPSIIEVPYVSTKDWSILDGAECEAMEQLAHFLQTCQALEGLSTPDPNSKAQDNGPAASSGSHNSVHKFNSSAPTIASGLSFINIPPRPKLSTATTALQAHNKENEIITWQKYSRSDTNVDNNIQSNWNSADSTPATWFKDDSELKHQTLQSRFIASVGWCVRYGSTVSQGGRYKIMFLDGVALDIDVDEDWVEIKDQLGKAVRYKTRDCNSRRDIGERMKTFEEFISLFDDSHTWQQ